MKSLSALAVLVFTASPVLAQSSAMYEVRFDSTWSSQTHPNAFPGGAHWSPPIGGTHSDAVQFWQPGGIATNGVEVMAETGGATPLRNEVLAAIGAGTAGEVVQGSGLGTPAVQTLTFEVSDEFPLITLVTMIAPSPDWFVGTSGLSLRENGEWIPSVTVPLIAWDAGTDAGTDFGSSNSDVNPHDPITLITGGPFFGNDPLGTFTFTLLSGVSELCNGDGGDQMGCTNCPCDNDAPQGTIGGCQNSVGTSARLLASGTTSVGAANLRMEASGLPPSVSAVLTSGAAIAPANMSNPCFGLNSGIQSISLDGLRCAVQGVLRHGVRASDANGDVGASTNGWGTPDNFFQFGAFVAGDTRYFQIIHRDDAATNCQTGQNTSQAVSATFTM